MQILRIELKPVNSEFTKLRYWTDASQQSSERYLKINEIQQLIEQGEAYYDTTQPDLERVGKRLFNWLDGEGRWLTRSIQTSQNTGLILAISAEERLASLPWEVLHNKEGFIVERSQAPVVPVRLLSSTLPSSRSLQQRALQILFMATAPEVVQPALDFEQEEASILQFTASLPLTLRVEESGSIHKMAELWRKYPANHFDIFHLTGHASIHHGQPVFMAETETGELHLATPLDIIEAFSNRLPQLVFLSGCRTAQASEEGMIDSMAAAMVRLGLPAVLGWGLPVLDTTATAAAAQLYQRLAEGFSIAEALGFTYKYLIKERIADWHLLRLQVQDGGWAALVEPPGDYIPPIETIQDQFLDPEGRVRVARPDQFVGRRRLLQESLRHIRRSHVLLLHGLGGNGKSTVAARLLERLSEYESVVFYRYFDENSLLERLAGNCESERGHEILSKSLPLASKLSLFFRQGLNDPKQLFCFVLDDFEANLEEDSEGKQVLSPTVVPAIVALLNAISQSGRQHRVIITSRYLVNFPVDSNRVRIKPTFVPALSGADLTKKYSRLPSFQPGSSVDKQLQQWAKISADGNPRLLEWLDLVLQDQATESATILTRMLEKEAEFRESVLAEELLNQQSDSFCEFLSRAIVFDLAVPEEALIKVVDNVSDYEQHQHRAISIGLLEVSHPRGKYSLRVPKVLTPLLAVSTRNKSFEEENILTLYKAAADVLYDVWWVRGDPSIVEEQVRELYRITVLAEYYERAISLGEALTKYWDNQESYRKAIFFAEEGLLLERKTLGENHENVVLSLNNLSILYMNQGIYDKAEQLLREALAIRTQRLGEEHTDVALCLNNLATLYGKQGRYEEAEALCKRVLDIYIDLLGDEHPDVARSLNNLAMLYHSLGQYDVAEPLLKNATNMWKALRGNKHSDYILGLNNLAVLYDKQGRYAQAECLYQESLSLLKLQSKTDRSSNIARGLNNLAMIYYKQGRYNQAAPLAREAVEMWISLLGEEHPDVALSINNLATIRSSQGRYEEVESLYHQSLNIWRRLLGEHPHVALSLNNIGLFYSNQERYNEAESFLTESLFLYRKLVGEDHPDMCMVLNNLGMVYNNQERYKEAEMLLKEALKLCEKLSGDEHHPDIAATLNNLASVYRNQESYEESEALYRQAIEISKKLLGEEHVQIAASLGNLASVCQSQDRYEEAESLYFKAQKIYQKMLGVSHPDSIINLANLADLYAEQNRYKEAESTYKTVIELYKETLGEKHPNLAYSFNGLANLYSKQMLYDEASAFYQQALLLRKQSLNPDDRKIVYSLNNLATIYERQDRYEESTLLREEAVSLNRQQIGDGDITTCSSMVSLGISYYKQGIYQKADSLCREILAIPDLPSRDSSVLMNTLSLHILVLSAWERESETEPIRKKVIALRSQILGEKHPDVMGDMHRLAVSYTRQNRFDEARLLHQQVSALQSKIIGEDHPDYAHSLSGLAATYFAQNHFEQAESVYAQSWKIFYECFGSESELTKTARKNMQLAETRKSQKLESKG